jgi:hypothetical protein
MFLRRSVLGSLRRVVAVVAMLGLAAGPAPLSAAASGHCGARDQAHAGHAGTAAQTGAVARAMGAGMPGDCPHCAAAECAVLAPCASGVAAVGAAMPALAVAGTVRPTAAPAVAGLTSLALAPPTPPPLPLS